MGCRLRSFAPVLSFSDLVRSSAFLLSFAHFVSSFWQSSLCVDGLGDVSCSNPDHRLRTILRPPFLLTRVCARSRSFCNPREAGFCDRRDPSLRVPCTRSDCALFQLRHAGESVLTVYARFPARVRFPLLVLVRYSFNPPVCGAICLLSLFATDRFALGLAYLRVLGCPGDWQGQGLGCESRTSDANTRHSSVRTRGENKPRSLFIVPRSFPSRCPV